MVLPLRTPPFVWTSPVTSKSPRDLLPVWLRKVTSHLPPRSQVVKVRHLGFLKYLNFIGWRNLETRDASLCQILSKLVNPLRKYHIFDCQDGGRPPSWICLGHIWTTLEGYLVVFIFVQNLGVIDAAVLIIYESFNILCVWLKTPIHAQKNGV